MSTQNRPTPTAAQAQGSFQSFGLCAELTDAVEAAGYQAPRPIQAATLPQALEGRDVLGLAQTGTGKTAAFAIPIIQRLMGKRSGKPRALVLAPTRELAMQIHAEFQSLARFTKLTSMTIFGGVGAGPQIKALRNRPDVIVACPGRLLDLVGSGDAQLGGVEVLVLDEADHMFDMGFMPDIRRILARLPATRQNLLFSATMPKEIRGLADKVLHKPHVVEIAHAAPLETIEHALYAVGQKQKTSLLLHLLGEKGFRSAIVFLRTKHRAKKLARDLDRLGHRAVALQGNMSQGQRQSAMSGFRSGHYDVLVATDIAARGIDVAAVSHVINFDLPNTPEAYTHRIGRTGRAECTGKAYTFATREDAAAVRDIERTLGMAIPRVRLEGFDLQDDSAVVLAGVDEPRGPRGGGRQGGGRNGGGRSGGGGRRSGAGAGKGGGAGKPRRSRGAGARGAATRSAAAGESKTAEPAKRSVLGYRGTTRRRSL